MTRPGTARRERMAEHWIAARERRLRVAETFVSLQGEGSRTGLPTFFLRLTGCALRCVWCDTAWAFTSGQWRGLLDLESEILATGLPRVCVTGGEPLLQPSVVPLIARLHDDHGLDVCVETGGDQDISVLPAGVCRILDVKLPGSGMSSRMDLANLGRLTPADEVKLVVAGREDYVAARDLVRGPLAGFDGEILVGAVHGSVAPADLARWVLDDRLAVRVQVQLHKVLWPNHEKGV